MKNRIGAAMIAVLGILLLTQCQTCEREHTELSEQKAWDRDSIESLVDDVLQEQLNAWNEGDVDGYMAGYWKSPDLRFVTGRSVIAGHDSLTANYKRAFPDRGAMGKLNFEIRDKKWMGDSVVNVLGRWMVTTADTGRSGNFSILFMPVEEGWRIVEDHTW